MEREILPMESLKPSHKERWMDGKEKKEFKVSKAILTILTMGFSLMVIGASLPLLLEGRPVAFSSFPVPRVEPQGLENPIHEKATCNSLTYNWPPNKPENVLLEMSGIVASRLYRETLYHVTDSGNDPMIIATDLDGHLLQEIPYRDRSFDVEALSSGPCPWGGSFCLYAADTGDNLHFRAIKRIDVMDERTLFRPPLRTLHVEFKLSTGEALDVESLAVHPLTGDLFIFSKEPKKSRVFRLSAAVWHLDAKIHIAEEWGEIGHGMVSDAAWSKDGSRLLVLSSQGIWERTNHPTIGSRQVSGWLPYERSLGLPLLDQQEAISYLSDDRSVVYSSEKKRFRNERWGIVVTRCKP